MMKDCPDCTIRMSLAQFHSAVLCNAAAGFEITNKKLTTISASLRDKLVGKHVSEKDYSVAWAKIDNEHELCPGHFLHLSEDHYEGSDKNKNKIDGSLILKADRHRVEPRVPNWALQQLSIEFKRGGTSLDPFDDRLGHDPDSDARSRRTVRGQIMSYAETVFRYQHRTALFMLFVNGDTFRAMRWDRSGVIVTEAVNYIKSSLATRELLKVLYAFSKLSPEQQGRDMTAIPLSPNSCGWKRMDALATACPSDLSHEERWLEPGVEIHPSFLDPKASSPDEELDDGDDCLHQDPTCCCPDPSSTHPRPLSTIPVFTHIREYFRRSLQRGYPRYVLKVDGKDYLVGAPHFTAFGIVGRGTKGFVALEWKTQRLVWFKDSWRPYYDFIDSEGFILDVLNKGKVFNIPTVITHKDVHGTEPNACEQQTETSEYSPVTGHKRVSLPPTASQTSGSGASGKSGKRTQVRNPPSQLRSAMSGSTSKFPMTVDPREYNHTPSTSQSSMISPTLVASTPNQADAARYKKPSIASLQRGIKRSADDVENENAHLQGTGLRHMVHTRLVVREICLPFTDFTSSRQLVRIIFDCLCAHEMAFVKCKYMHRDVSAGNLLIHPRVVRDDKARKYRVYWQGLLADWELAKHETKQVALQPERTGTWHFMSVSLLTAQPGAPVTIPDELEAFTHVLVYGAFRRMNSNIQPDAMEVFHHDYFEGHTRDMMGRPIVPYAKSESVLQGQLVFGLCHVAFSTPAATDQKDHILNTLIKRLLRIFRSRYAVQTWEARSRALDAPQTPARQILHAIPESQSSPSPSNDLFEEVLAELDTEDEDSGTEDEDEQMDKGPTRKMYRNAKQLETHKKVRTIFKSFLSDHDKVGLWPSHDVLTSDEMTQRSLTETAAQPSKCTPDTNRLVTGNTAEAQLATGAHPPVLDATLPAFDAPEAGPSESTENMRPTKRARRAPAAPTETANEAPARRVTRSRSAANVAAQAAAAGPAAPQTNMRRTRSMSGIVARRPGQGNTTATTSAGTSAGTGTRVTRSTSRRSLRGDGAGDAKAAGGSRGNGRGGRGGRGRAASGRR